MKKRTIFSNYLIISIFFIFSFLFNFDVNAISNRYDVDSNSNIDSVDAQLTLRKAESMDMSATNWQESSITGDVDCNGVVNSDDAHLLLRKSIDADMSLTNWCYDSYEISIAKTTDGAEPSTDASFTVTVSPANNSGSAITGDIAYTGTATNGTDYATGDATFSIADGSDTAVITLSTTDDTDVEGTETIIATISNASVGTITTDNASADLTDDDNYSLSIAKTTDGAEPSTDASFTVTVSPANNSGSAITGDIAYTGTATNGTDYATGDATFSIADGSDTAVITLSTTDDTDVEGTETIIATISNASVGTITTDNASADLTDDDTVDTDKSIYIIGDSTVRRHNVTWDVMSCSAGNTDNTLQGWGDSLNIYMIHSENQINRARQGAAAKEFLDGPPGGTNDQIFRQFVDQSTPLNRYWSPTETAIQNDSKNKFLLIQFGSSNEVRYYDTVCDGDPRGKETCTEEEFKDAVKYYIDRAKALGATPILITTPVSRIKNPDGSQNDNRGPYPGYVADLATSENVQLLDLHAKTLEEFGKYSETKLREVFGQCVHDPGGSNERVDTTHFEPGGANIVAGWIKELACDLPNQALCEQFSTTVDHVIPTISLVGDYTTSIEQGDNFTDPGSSAQDDVDGDISANVVVTGSVDTNIVGTYELKYNVSDNAGNQAIEVTRVVNVLPSLYVYEDAEDSDISDWTVYAGDVGVVSNIEDVAKGSRVIKLSGPNGTGDGFRYGSGDFFNDSDKFVISWDMNFSNNYRFYVSVGTSAGDKTMYYDSSDTSGVVSGMYKIGLGAGTKDGNWHTIVRNLIDDMHSIDPAIDVNKVYRIAVRGSGMIDNVKMMKQTTSSGNNVKPVVTINGDAVVTVAVSATYSDAGATASDDSDGDITSDISTDNPVDTAVEGDYTVTYTVHDSTGNGAYAKRTVQVRDNMSMIEDAEDGDTVGWDMYGDTSGATITNVVDADKNSNVLAFNGNGLNAGYRYIDINELSDFTVSWRLKYSEPFKFMVKVRTDNHNPLYVYYAPDDLDDGFYTDTYDYIHNAVGADLDSGEWESFTRDIEADIKRFLPNDTLQEIISFRVRGSGRVDDISTSLRNSSSKFAFGGHTYEIVKTARTWQDASDDAESKGGYLANIGSKLENDEIYARLSKYITSSEYSNTVASNGGNASYVWIGGTDSATEGTWIWKNTEEQFWNGDVGGTAVNGLFTNWGRDTSKTQHEPDNSGDQDALAMAITEWTLGSGNLGQTSQWNDLKATDSLYYIIEYNN